MNNKMNCISKVLSIFFCIILLTSCKRIAKPDRFHYFQSFEELKGWFEIPPSITSEIIPHSGTYSAVTHEGQSYSPTFKIQFKDIDEFCPKRLEASVWCYTTSTADNGKFCLIIKNEKDETKLWFDKSIKVSGIQPQHWSRLELSVDIPKEVYSPNNQIGIFFWNTEKGKIYVDDFTFVAVKGTY